MDPLTSRSSSSSSATSTSHSSRRHFPTSFITLTIACYLLLQVNPPPVCSAAPIPKRLPHAKQRSIAQQVHHVQIVDESVHNTMVLLKKSMQKRSIQQKQKKQLQQPTNMKQKKRDQLQKRMVEDSVSTVDMVPPNLGRDSSNVLEEEKEGATEKRRDGQPAVNRIKQHSLSPNKNTIKKGAKQFQRSRLISAYETIVFSESQIPVFLSQDHHRQRFRLGAKSKSASKKQMWRHKQQAQQQFETTTKTPFETEENDTTIDQKVTQHRHRESGTRVGTSDEQSNQLDSHDSDINSPVGSVINAQLHNKVLPISQAQNPIDQGYKEESQLQDAAHVAFIPYAGVGSSVAEHSGQQQVPSPSTLGMRHDANFQQVSWYNNDSWCCSSSVLILFGLLAALLSYKLYAHKQHRSLSSVSDFSAVSAVESSSLKTPMTDAGRTTATRQ